MAGIGSLVKRFGGSATHAAASVAVTATHAAVAVVDSLKTDVGAKMKSIQSKIEQAQAERTALEREHRQAAYAATGDDADGAAVKHLAGLHKKIEDADRRIADLEAAAVVAAERVEQVAAVDAEAQRKAKAAELEKLAKRIQKAAETFDEHRAGLMVAMTELKVLAAEAGQVGGIRAAGRLWGLRNAGQGLITNSIETDFEPGKRIAFGPRIHSLAEQVPDGAALVRSAGLTGKGV